METMTVEDARRELIARIEEAMSFVETTDDPVREDNTPAPCWDDITADPEKGRADMYFVVPVKFGTSWAAARAVEDGLGANGWSIRRNTGAPEDQLMFFASKDDYAMTVSGEKGNIGSIVIAGTSPCLPR